jgi:hypothetical protein
LKLFAADFETQVQHRRSLVVFVHCVLLNSKLSFPWPQELHSFMLLLARLLSQHALAAGLRELIRRRRPPAAVDDGSKTLL